MTEQVMQFGPGQALQGILTLPEAAVTAGDFAVLLINAGVIRRIGPRRINVKIARQLLQQGIASFRFDLSGLGDSMSAQSPRPGVRQSVADIQSAMDILQSVHGTSRFAIFGVCSGAVDAFWTAHEDERVVGIYMFDGFWYRTILSRPAQVWRWLRNSGLPYAVRYVASKFLGWSSSRTSAEQSAVGVFNASAEMANPPRAVFAQMINKLWRRGVSMVFFYGGSVSRFVSYRNQFRHAFRGELFLKDVESGLDTSIDHNFVTLVAQKKMIDRLVAWVQPLKSRSG